MKKKHFVPIFLILFLVALSACQSEGSQNHADAGTEPELESAVIEEAVAETNSSIQEDDEAKLLPVQDSTEERKDQQPSNQQDISPQETVMIDGYKYILIMDEAEYPNLIHLISAAKNHGAQLYGIAYSDVFAILKDGKTIAHMTAGYKSVLPEHADMIKAMFSVEYTGIQGDIDFVIKNNLPVERELYSITLKEGWLEINYM